MAGSPDDRAGFERLYGLEVLSASADEVRARVPVHDGVRQPAGLVHGGVYVSIAESLATLGTEHAVGEQGKVAIGLAGQTSFLRPITEGTVHAVARPRHRGRSTWVWEVDVTDDRNRLCALVRMTVSVRDAP